MFRRFSTNFLWANITTIRSSSVLETCIFSAVVLLIASGFCIPAVSARSSSGDDEPEVVISFGISQDDAVRKGLRQAVSQRCGENLKARTIERNSFNKTTSLDGENVVSGSQDSDIATKSELAATTGGIIRRYRQAEVSQEAPNRYRVVVEVYIEKCLVEGAGRISIRGSAPIKNQQDRKEKVDPKSFVEREVTVTVRYQVPPTAVDTYTLKALVLATAQSFALNVVKAEVSPGADMQPITSRVQVIDVRDLETTREEYGLDLQAKVTLFGVNQEIDGNTMADGAWGDVTKFLALKSGYSSVAGFSFYMNESNNSAVVYDVDRRGSSLGKILRGDIIESVNGIRIQSIKQFPSILDNAITVGPASLFIRRGSATLVVIIRQ